VAANSQGLVVSQKKVDIQPGVHGNQRIMTIEVETKQLDKNFILELQKIANNPNRPHVDGFQDGKPLPLKAAQQKFGESIRQELVAKLMQENFEQAIRENQLRPAGLPNIEIIQDQMGQPLIFKTTFDVIPNIDKVNGLDKIKVEKWTAEVKPEDVDQMLETMRRQHATWEVKTDRPAKNEDRVTVDFEGLMDGQKFDGGSANDVPLVLGSNMMIEGFEAGLVGVTTGEEKLLSLTFPADYHVQNLAGKPVEFKVKIKEIAEPVLPPMDQAFAEKFNVTSLEKLTADVRSNMERELEFVLKDKVKNQVMDILVENNQIEVPDPLARQETERLKQQAIARLGVTPEQLKQLPPMPEDIFKDQAKRRVTLGILLSKLVEELEIKPDQERVKALINKLSSAYEDPQSVVDYYYQNPEQMLELEQSVLEEMLVEKILERGQVTQKEMSFFEVIKSMGPGMMNPVG